MRVLGRQNELWYAALISCAPTGLAIGAAFLAGRAGVRGLSEQEIIVCLILQLFVAVSVFRARFRGALMMACLSGAQLLMILRVASMSSGYVFVFYFLGDLIVCIAAVVHVFQVMNRIYYTPRFRWFEPVPRPIPVQVSFDGIDQRIYVSRLDSDGLLCHSRSKLPKGGNLEISVGGRTFSCRTTLVTRDKGRNCFGYRFEKKGLFEVKTLNDLLHKLRSCGYAS